MVISDPELHANVVSALTGRRLQPHFRNLGDLRDWYFNYVHTVFIPACSNARPTLLTLFGSLRDANRLLAAKSAKPGDTFPCATQSVT